MTEPWIVPFGWTVAVVLLSFMTGEMLGRAGLALPFVIFWGTVFSVVLAAVRVLLMGIWT